MSQLSEWTTPPPITQLSTEELALQAAQESYASIAKLSLFNYLSVNVTQCRVRQLPREAQVPAAAPIQGLNGSGHRPQR